LDINALFNEIYPSLFRYCHRLTADMDIAEDVAQETFVRLLDRKPKGPEQGQRAWMFRVATNLIRDSARQEANRGRILAGSIPPDPAPGPDTEMDRIEAIREVRKSLEQLSPRDREILLLRHEGLSYKEIAEVMDMSFTSVGTILARALRRFAAIFHKEN
jgi:RNA polymerase sigma-70 factor (ECF subfamily)